MNKREIILYFILFIMIVIIVIGAIYILKPELLKNLKNLKITNLVTQQPVEEPPPPSNNGQYYDYSKLNIKPTITFVPPVIINVPPIIKGSIVSTTLASEEYNKNYRIYSGTDVATVVTQDSIPTQYNKLKPKVLIDLGTNDNIFEWKDGDKCYIPDNYIPEKNDYKRDRNNNIKDAYIVLGECNKNNAKYKIINGYIQHIDTNKYLKPSSNNDNPSKYENLILSNLEPNNIIMKNENNEDIKLTVPKVFIENNSDIEKMQFFYENNKLIHKSSEYCVAPLCLSNNTISNNCDSKLVLSLVDCEEISNK